MYKRQDAARFFPLSTRVIRDGVNKAIRVFDLEAGDRVAVRNQELIPGDGILMSHNALIDYSYVSGEAEPVYKVAGEMLYAGGRAVEGALEMEVVRPFTDRRLRQLRSPAARKGVQHCAVILCATKDCGFKKEAPPPEGAAPAEGEDGAAPEVDAGAAEAADAAG